MMLQASGQNNAAYVMVLAVNDAVDPQLVLANKQHAVSPDNAGVVLTKVFPPLVYPEPVVVTSYVFVGSALGVDATVH